MKLKSLDCPNCGNNVDIKNEEQKFVFCSQCGSKLAVDDGVQKIEHTHKGEVTHKVEDLEKLEELKTHLKTAGGGSQLSKAASLAESGFLALRTGDIEKADQKFDEAVDIYHECRLALLGKVITGNASTNQAYVEMLQEGALTDVEKNVLKKHKDLSNLFACVFAKSGLAEHMQFLISVLTEIDAVYILDRAHEGEPTYYNGYTPLQNAVMFYKTPIVQMLLDCGADPNVIASNQTPMGLLAESYFGYSDGCKEKGETPDPLHEEEMFIALLDAGADVNIIGTTMNSMYQEDTTYGVTPAQAIIAKGEIGAAKLLLERKLFDPNAETEETGIVNFKMAIWYDEYEMADFLCQNGADVLLISKDMGSPIDSALSRAVKDKSSKMVEILLRYIPKTKPAIKYVKGILKIYKKTMPKDMPPLFKAALKG